MLLFHRPAVSILLVALATSCGDTAVRLRDAGGPDAMPSASCLEAENHSDLEWLQENVFTPSCSAFTACHKGRALSAGGLNLEAGNVLDQLLDQPSIEFPEIETLVTAGEPTSSYLLVVVGSRPGTLPEAGTMPYNNPLLCKPKRDALERWILSLGEGPDAGVPDAGTDDGGTPDAMAPDDALAPDAL
jgi:hypothetical protein